MHTSDQETLTPAWGRPLSRATVVRASDTDDEAVERFLAGDRTGFDVLFERHKDYVYNIVYGVLGRADDARDVTQEVFMLVYRSLRSFRRGSRFATWLYRIAVNKAVDAARAERRRKWTPFDETLQHAEAEGADPAESVELRSDQEIVRRVLQEVPPNHRDVLVLRYYQGMSVTEIAEVLGCTETAAKVRVHRARAKFREKYEAIYGKLTE